MEKIDLLNNDELEILKTDEIKKILFIGGSDTGKTTLIKKIANYLFKEGIDIFIFDCDIGQSHVGPPTTIGYAKVKNLIDEFYLEPEKFYFTGSVTPATCIIEFLTGITKINNSISRKKGKILIDTTGYIKDKLAIFLKIHKIEIIMPEIVVLIERENELEEIKKFLAYTEIKFLNIKLSENLPVKTIEERAKYRNEIFKKYFSNKREFELDINKVSIKFLNFKNTTEAKERINLCGYLCSLKNKSLQDICLGIIESVNENKIKIIIPEKDINEISGITISNFSLNLWEVWKL